MSSERQNSVEKLVQVKQKFVYVHQKNVQLFLFKFVYPVSTEQNFFISEVFHNFTSNIDEKNIFKSMLQNETSQSLILF